MMTVMERARRMVERCEPAVSGSGGHGATFKVAALLVWGFNLAPEEAFPLMMEYNSRCMPPWKEYEIWHKLRSVLTTQHRQALGHFVNGDEERGSVDEYVAPKAREKVTYDESALRKVAARVPYEITDAWLAERSPVCPVDMEPGAVLDLLYGPEDKVMVFGSMRSLGDYMRWRGNWYALAKEPGRPAERVMRVPPRTREGMIFLIQPVDGVWHQVTGQPRLSRRTRASIETYPYLLLESDEAPRDLWLKALVQLRLPVVAIVSSGGRSLHALVKIGCKTYEEWVQLVECVRDLMAKIGCDSQALRNPMVNCRMPGIMREGKMKDKKFVPYSGGPMKQRLLWLNPTAVNTPMMEVLPRA